jgi:hypothetical protein
MHQVAGTLPESRETLDQVENLLCLLLEERLVPPGLHIEPDNRFGI